MAWINSQFSMQDAVSRGFQTWDLLISDWGRLASVDPYSFSFPKVGEPGLPTVYGVAIGNQSQIDRCFVAYDIEKLIQGTITWDVAHRLSVGSPLMFPQLGTKDIVQTPVTPPIDPAQGASTVVIYPTGTAAISSNGGVSPTLFAATYRKFDGTVAAFPAVSPLLHLVFYLKPPTIGPVPKRAPMALAGSTTPTAAEHLFVIPTFGRKTLTVDLSFIKGGATADFRIATISNATNLFEVPRAADTGVASGVAKHYQIDSAFSDFLMVYYTPSAGAGTLLYSITATDD